MACRNWQPRFIVGIPTIIIRQIFVVIIFVRLKQALGVLFPGAEVVFIKNNQIPVGCMYPFILRLYTAGAFVNTKKILKRAKADDWFVFSGVLVLNICVRLT